MASASARPKGVRPPGGEFFRAAVRCSCSDRRPMISAAGSLRSRPRLPALSDWPHRPPGTDPASRKVSRRSRPIRAKVFRDLPHAAAGAPLQTCASPTTGPVRHAALREPLRSPCGLPAWLPKLVLSLCSYPPPRDLRLIFITIRCPRKSWGAGNDASPHLRILILLWEEEYPPSVLTDRLHA